MKAIVVVIASCLLISSAFAQTDTQNDLINKINTLSGDIKSNPDDAQLYVKRGEAIFMLNSLKPHQTWVSFTLADALSDIDQAIQLKPEDAKLYGLRAEYKRNIHQDLRGAINDMNKAVELQPNNPQWYFQRASYRKLTYGCADYERCADMGDKGCKEMMQAVCGKEL